jgi:hypothetical protein
MRLLDTTTFELCSAGQEYFKSEGYAILSHRWIGAEITFQEIEGYNSQLRSVGNQQIISPQLDKIRGACRTAHQLGFRWIWIDNCCINKESATELSESINSMFKWYRDAHVCITYLSDVELKNSCPQTKSAGFQNYTNTADGSIFRSVDGKTNSEWFSRGWTLQELLAPRDMRFYDINWDYMGTKATLATEIAIITGIDALYLTGVHDFRRACIATKMSWMAGRITTREEDIAYGMLGLFNIMMTPQYGEGQRAFMRLQQELLARTTDESLFAWQMPDPNAGEKFGLAPASGTAWAPDEWGMLAPTPDWFKTCGNMTIEDGARIVRPAQVFQHVREGVQIPVGKIDGEAKYQVIWHVSSFTVVGALPAYFLLKRHMKNKLMRGTMFTLNCWGKDEKGKQAAVTICLQPVPGSSLNIKDVGSFRSKRIKASEMLYTYKYAQKKHILGQGVVLQPDLTYME